MNGRDVCPHHAVHSMRLPLSPNIKPSVRHLRPHPLNQMDCPEPSPSASEPDVEPSLPTKPLSMSDAAEEGPKTICGAVVVHPPRVLEPL